MRITFSIFFVLLFIFFDGCFDEKSECTDSERFVGLSILSSSDIDSVQFYLNYRRVCYGSTGLRQKMVICKDSTERKYAKLMLLAEVNMENCMVSEDNAIWYGFDCLVGGGADSIDVDSSELSVKFFWGDKEKEIKTDLFVMGGSLINIVPEKDTAKWFSYQENPARPKHESFESPAKSDRMGCFDDFCFAKIPMEEKEFCYSN